MAPAIMFQGTGSDVGKSLIVAGLCRLFARRGIAVVPFKPQNMSNNAAVTSDGGEIGRAQALQARAAGIPANVDMNPVLLKPQSGGGAQLVVRGRVRAATNANNYKAVRAGLLDEVLGSYRRLAADADLVLVEGAGSAAEVNLRAGDIANMGFAEAADVPVAMIGDIDRGGVIASLIGTHALLTAGERRRIAGFIVNRFRGEAALFADGMTEIADRTGWPGLGLVPWFDDLYRLPAEDAVTLEYVLETRAGGDDAIRVVVPLLPGIANFDDLDPLAAEADVVVDMVRPGRPIPRDADLVVLPGSKSTLADLAFLRAQGWDVDILAHVRHGGAVMGICAGLQMLGRRIADPRGIEGMTGSADGLGLLDLETVIGREKKLRQVRGEDIASGAAVAGYEMHMGRTVGDGLTRPMLRLAGRPDGAVSPDRRVMGCYLHGLFAADDFRHRFLATLRPGRTDRSAYDATVDDVLDRWAGHLDAHVDTDALLAAAGYQKSASRKRRARPIFDDYVVIDWSSAGVPRTGKDSIWIGWLARRGDQLELAALENPATRYAAMQRLVEIVGEAAGSGRRLLLGFDFPNGYPKGFGRKAGFRSDTWRAVWDGIAGLLKDGEDNGNNRFFVGSELNRRLSGARHPFWGHPWQHAGRYAHLPPRPAGSPALSGIADRRICEEYVPSAKTVWQLAYNGSVGAQALTGIPVQRRLRRHALFGDVIRVWPFETGLAPLSRDGNWRAVIAEVYPSLFDVGPKEGRDRWQVENTARVLAARDASGDLSGDFAGPDGLTTAQRRIVEKQEGWILCAGTMAPDDPMRRQLPK